MRRSVRQNLQLLCLLGVLLLLAATLQLDPERPNVEFLPNMAHQASFNAFEATRYFDDGKTLQAPVEGTIPRGEAPLRYGTGPEEAARAGRELKNPFATDGRAALKRGAIVYQRFCVPCHGADGAGNGPVARRGFPPPPSLLTEKVRKLPDGQIFHVLTYGQGNMPSYAAQITREDRWRAILFLRSLEVPQ